MTLVNTQTQVPVLTVSQLTQAIKLSLESTFPHICLQGEISNFIVQTSGHLYFSLKDAHAQIAVVMFRSDAAMLRTMPKPGDHVLVKGEINVYPAKGNYQLVIRELSYVGLGALLQELEHLKIKLHQKGWFKAARKKPLPRFPKRIGVVTSPTGAVIQDILNILSRRFSGFHLILNPVKVQGEGAAQEIAQAIEQFNRYKLVDVMIVGRGGGSLEDLWAFNEEIVAEAIYHSQIPIISAVGHETDHCIADYVADVRAPTPSAAAEIVIGEKTQSLQYLDTIRKRMRQTIHQLIQKERYRLNGFLRHPFLAHPITLLESRMQLLDDKRIELDETIQQILERTRQRLDMRQQQSHALKPTNQLVYFRQKLRDWHRELHQTIQSQLILKRHCLLQKNHLLNQIWQSKERYWQQKFNKEKICKRLDHLIHLSINGYQDRLISKIAMLKAIDPKNLLNKGYSILLAEKEPRIINSVNNLRQQQKLRVVLSDGEALIAINEIISINKL